MKNWIGRNSLKTNQICDWTTLRFWVLKLLVKVACEWWPLNFFVFSFMKDDNHGGLMVSKELYGWWKGECVFFLVCDFAICVGGFGDGDEKELPR